MNTHSGSCISTTTEDNIYSLPFSTLGVITAITPENEHWPWIGCVANGSQ